MARKPIAVASLLLLLGVAAVGAEPTADALTASSPDLQWGPCPPIFPKGCEIAVLRGDPAQPNADVFLRVPAKYDIPPHTHTSAERMVLVAGELHVTYKGRPRAILKPGTYAYGPPKAPHKAACVGPEACVLFIAFESAVDAHPFDGTLE